MYLEIVPNSPPQFTASIIGWVDLAKKFARPSSLTKFNLERTDFSDPDQAEPVLGLGYDCDYLYLQLTLSGPVHATSARSWRSGDGILFTVSPELADTDKYISLGFAGAGKESQVLVVNNSGRWFPKVNTAEIQYRLTYAEGISLYQIAIPWSRLPPIHPLPLAALGINVTFIRSLTRGRAFYQLEPDNMFDTERTNQRKVVPLAFGPCGLDRPKAQTTLTKARWLGKEPLELYLGVFSPGMAPAELEVSIHQQETELEKYCFALELAPGSHRWVIRLSPHRNLAPGLYTLRVTGRGGGAREYVASHPFIALIAKDAAELAEALSSMENDLLCLHQPAVQTALAKLKWIEGYTHAPPWEVNEKPLELLTHAQMMLVSLRAGNDPLYNQKGLTRRAFRSKLDGTLQPYSLILPKTYSSERRWPLLVLLHGSGVDDQHFAAHPDLPKLADRLGLVILLPMGRDPSGWYLDDCETDIFEAINAAKASLSLDWSKIFLAGFSMGGFGTWHTGLRHASQFAGLAVLSGTPRIPPAFTVKPEYDFDPRNYANSAENLPILVVHGACDEAIDIDLTRETVTSLQDKGVDITWREISKAGHGNYDWPAELTSWLKLQLKK